MLLEAMRQAPAMDFASLDPAQVRAAFDQPMLIGPPPAVASVTDLVLELPGRSLAARLYVPETGEVPPPLTLFFHGGGWVVGTLETHDGTARALARESGSAVLSVAYRLAPEHPYPQPLEDCYDACCHAAAIAAEFGCDGTRLAVAGDSAGANLAAAVAILARDRGGPALRHQLLLYPVTDCDFARASYRENGGGEYFLGRDAMEWFWGHYLAGREPGDAPLAVIGRQPDLDRLPPATVITAEFDPLRDEGMDYARRLAADGVPVEAEVAPGMIHGFFGMFEAVPDVWPWIGRAGQALRRALA